MKEKLTLMARIQSLTGVEPAMWLYDTGDASYEWKRKKQLFYSSVAGSNLPAKLHEPSPWLPLEQALDLLPDSVGVYDLGFNKRGIGYLPSESENGFLYWESSEGDLHLAALKLLVTVLEGKQKEENK